MADKPYFATANPNPLRGPLIPLHINTLIYMSALTMIDASDDSPKQ